MKALDVVSCQEFCISDETDIVVCAESLEDDPFYLRLHAEPQSNVMHGSQNRDDKTWHVRTVGMEEEGEWIVLDSGADVSLLPHRFLAGQEVQSPDLRLEDAQDNQIQVGGMRKAQVEFDHCL